MTEVGRRIPTVVSEGPRVVLFSQCLGSEAAFGKALGSDADTAAVRSWALHSRPTINLGWGAELVMHGTVAQYR